MNSRERVMRALRRDGLPDRVPLQFDLSRPLLEAFSEKLDIPIGWQPNYYEDLKYRTSGNEIRTAMGSDCVIVGGGVPAGFVPEETDDGCIVNEFGMKMKMGIGWYDVVKGPLEECTTVQEVMDLPFPDPDDAARYEDARRYIDKYKGEYFIIGTVELTMFEMAWHMTGLQKFMTDMALGEPYIEALIDRTMAFSLAVGKNLVELGVDGIWTGDDFGAQNGMMVSPAMWRQIFKPRMAEVFRQFKAVNPDVVTMYHCDGAIAPILPDLIEIGLEVFNPVQPGVPGHEPGRTQGAVRRQPLVLGRHRPAVPAAARHARGDRGRRQGQDRGPRPGRRLHGRAGAHPPGRHAGRERGGLHRRGQEARRLRLSRPRPGAIDRSADQATAAIRPRSRHATPETHARTRRPRHARPDARALTKTPGPQKRSRGPRRVESMRRASAGGSLDVLWRCRW